MNDVHVDRKSTLHQWHRSETLFTSNEGKVSKQGRMVGDVLREHLQLVVWTSSVGTATTTTTTTATTSFLAPSFTTFVATSLREHTSTAA
jgi:hypothetical protein